MGTMNRKIKRGDIFYTELAHGVGSEQNGKRPTLIISNNIGNNHSGTVIVAIITSKTERKHIMPTHCRIQSQYGLPRVSYILLEQLQTIDKSRLLEYVGTLSNRLMRKVDKALAVGVGLR